MTKARVSPVEKGGLFLFSERYLEVQIDSATRFILYS